jgi:hypothetical protein
MVPKAESPSSSGDSEDEDFKSEDFKKALLEALGSYDPGDDEPLPTLRIP